MKKEQNVIEFYVLCNRLKDVVRTGWKNWGVQRERVESIAEHVYGVQMLALAMWSEFGYDIDIKKVLTMLAFHETEEIVIGDITCFDEASKTKAERGHDAIKRIFGKLESGADIEKLILEFDERQTPEARFAYFCDKLECDLQCKLYDEQSCVDLNSQENNSIAQSQGVKGMLDSGMSWSEMWIAFGQGRYNYDENFMAVSNFAKENNILKQEESSK